MTKEKHEIEVKTSKCSGQNFNLLLVIIVVLVVIIAVMGFFLGRLSSGGNNSGNTNVNNYTELSIKIIKDKKDTITPIDDVVSQLKNLPSISSAKITTFDFSDKGIADYLKENNIKYLPAVIFSTNNFDVSNDPVQYDSNGSVLPKINSYLQVLPNGNEFALSIGGTYDPTIDRSKIKGGYKGFPVLDESTYNSIKESTYVDGNVNTEITWLEFSDLQCAFCAKLYTDGTLNEVKVKYGDKINVRFTHFPLSFHPNAEPAAEIIECLAAQKGSTAYYDIIEIAFNNNDKLNVSDTVAPKAFLIAEAVKLGANEKTLTECVNAKTYSKKIKDQLNLGTEAFAITGTPGNILVNNETLEYATLSGAYPISYFIEAIDTLLGN